MYLFVNWVTGPQMSKKKRKEKNQKKKENNKYSLPSVSNKLQIFLDKEVHLQSVNNRDQKNKAKKLPSLQQNCYNN